MEHGRASDYVTGEDFEEELESQPASPAEEEVEDAGPDVAELQNRIQALEAELAASRSAPRAPAIMTANPKPRPQGACAVSFYGSKDPTECRGLGKAEESGWFSPTKTGCSGGIRGVEEHPQGIPSVLCRLNPKQRKRLQNDTLMADMSATECWEAAERGRGFTMEHPLKSIAMNLPSWVKLLGRNDVINIE